MEDLTYRSIRREYEDLCAKLVEAITKNVTSQEEYFDTAGMEAVFDQPFYEEGPKSADTLYWFRGEIYYKVTGSYSGDKELRTLDIHALMVVLHELEKKHYKWVKN